ncbi:beta-lactamase [Rhizobium sp. TRM95111]|uniref:class C beta-lactamase n=1 Tax=Rhizobium alarense TaxID=2846851 RepID=UPI001F1C94DD|nr:class C beta-lactamase [Rhizobium alarense]MCF3642303.1 beta-lactamase [Rhizobium alarense]
MSRLPALTLRIAATACLTLAASSAAADDGAAGRLRQAVTAAVRPVMQAHGIPGMAVAVVTGGGRHVFNYGLADPKTGREVDDATLFEIGSVSKTFTATLGAYAGAEGALALDDAAGEHVPELSGSAFDRVSLLDLATYSAGGLPLQFPDSVTDEASMFAFYRSWRPAYAAGSRRVYSNPSIGLFGHAAANSLGARFDDLMRERIFEPFGLADTFLQVPEARMGDYAWGMTKDGRPMRVSPGAFDLQAYGVKTTAADLMHFVEAHIDASALDEPLQRALAATQAGYYRVGPMVQGLGWEFYPWPTALDTLLAGNAADMVMKPNAAERLSPPLTPEGAVLVNKTGSTNGFGAYVAFVPARGIGVVLLANRNYPIPDRVRAAHAILAALDAEAGTAE